MATVRAPFTNGRGRFGVSGGAVVVLLLLGGLLGVGGLLGAVGSTVAGDAGLLGMPLATAFHQIPAVLVLVRFVALAFGPLARWSVQRPIDPATRLAIMPAKPTAAQRRHEALRDALDIQRAALGDPPYSGPDLPARVLTECAAAVLRARDRGDTPETDAVRAVVRGSLAEFARRVPGQSVELRVPPFGAVQAVEGPRHTRGTPPSVVETDPLTWIALAFDRLSWQEAVAGNAVTASGERADLAPHLPLSPGD